MTKLNLGCGSKILSDYINVDKFEYYKPNIVHDLEKIPYPFEDNSVDEILLNNNFLRELSGGSEGTRTLDLSRDRRSL